MTTKQNYFMRCTCGYGSYKCTFDVQGDELAPNYLIKIVTRSFNNVEIVDNTTGEVLYEHYISTEIFEQIDTITSTMENIFRIFKVL